MVHLGKRFFSASATLCAAILLMACSRASATITAAYVSGTGSPSLYDGNVTTAAASGDIIKSGSSTLASVTVSSTSSLPGTFSTTGFYDGSAAANINYAYHALTDPTGDLPVDYTFTFAVTAGYNISEIQSVAGWTDSQLGDQDFDVYVKTTSNPVFTQIGSDFENAPFTGANTGTSVANATMTTITSSTGLIATGVTAIKFHLIANNFAQVTSNGSEQGTLYRDMAVIGTPTGGGTPPPPVPTIMPLGDSITDGRGGNNGNSYIPGGYRDPLYTNLHNANFSFKFVGTANDNSTPLLTAAGQSNHEGQTGYRIDQIASGINGWLSAAPANDILLMIGTNDITQHYDPTPTAPGTFEQHAASRLTSLIAQIYTDEPNADIFVSSIIPILTTANDPTSRWAPSVNASAQAYNQLIETQVVPSFLAMGDNIHFVDEYATFTNPDGSTNLSYYAAADDEHPGQLGYDAMAQTWSNAILSTVPEPSAFSLVAIGSLALVLRRRRNAVI
jgi:lysophospholipase L1-like esterase